MPPLKKFLKEEMIMVRTKKVCCMLLSILVGIFIFSTMVFATESDIPNATSYVNDFANIINDEVEKEMQERAETFAKDSDGIQVVVTTVQTIGDADPVEYTTDMYNQYEISKNNMGVLIMLSVETRDIQIRIGSNMTKYLSDRKCGEIRDEYGIPYFQNDEFEKGLNAMQEATIEYIGSKVESADNEVAVNPTQLDDIKSSGTFVKILCVVGIIACGIIIIVSLRKYFLKRKRNLQEKDKAIETLKSDLNTERSRNDSLRFDNAFLKQHLSETKVELQNLKERYKRAVLAYPDLDEKVDEIFAKEKEEADKRCAKKVEDSIRNVVNLECTRQNLSYFRNAYEAYENLSKEQQSYVPSELVNKIKKLYSASLELQREYEKEQKILHDKKVAKEVQESILGILSISVTRHSLDKLKRVCDAYDNLTAEQKKYVTADIRTVQDMRKRAKRMQDDYEEEERLREEERRRRDESIYNHFGGGSDFGGNDFVGFGGHSDGHGAGGKF